MFPLNAYSRVGLVVQDKKGNLRNSPAGGGLKHPRFFLTLFLLHKRPNIFIVLT